MRGAERPLRWPLSTSLVVLLLVTGLAGCLGGDDTDLMNDPEDPWADWFEDAQWDTRGAYSRVLEEGVYNVLPAIRHQVTAHDGVMLDTAVWLPEVEEGEQVPVIMDIGPYYGDSITLMNRGWREDAFFIENFVKNGYAYARAATRGTGTSGGCMEFFGPNEQRDVDTVLTHFGTQDWSNGKIALYGASYDGTTPWIGASTGNPHLATIVPVSGLSDVAGLMFRNGTAEGRGVFMHSFVYWTNYGVRPTDPLGYRSQYWPDQACEEFLIGTLEGPVTTVNGDVNTDYWKIRDWRQRVLDNYQGSVYMVHGMQDWNVEPTMAFPFMRDVEDAGLDVKMMLGQWGHDWPDRASRINEDDPETNKTVRWDWGELLMRWFDRELKGVDVPVGPTVDIQDSENNWRTEETWPPSDIKWKKLHLGDGVLANDTQTGGSSSAMHHGGLLNDVVGPIRDTGAAEDVEGRWVFETEPFDEELRFAGLPRLHAKFTTNVPDGNIMARLDLVDEDGNAKRVAHGVMNIRYHAGGTEPSDLSPGDAFVAKLEMFPADVLVPEDHTLRLSVYPNTLNEPRPRGPTPLELHWGDDASILKLPVVERDVGDGRYPGQPS